MDTIRARRRLILAAGALGMIASASTLAVAIAETHAARTATGQPPAADQDRRPAR
jgi:hypothetical protein